MTNLLNYTDQRAKIAQLEADLAPKDWQEGLVMCMLDPKTLKVKHFMTRVGLALLGVMVTVATLGLGYFLVRYIYRVCSNYQLRMGNLISEITRIKLYPAREYSAEQIKELAILREQKKPFDEDSYQKRSLFIQRLEQRLQNEHTENVVPEELKAEWRAGLQDHQEKGITNRRSTIYEMREKLSELPFIDRREDNDLVELMNIFDAERIKMRLQETFWKKHGRFLQLTGPVEDFLENLEGYYQERCIAIEACESIPTHVDLTAQSSFFFIQSDGIVIPTIYGSALIAAFYEIKYDVTIHMGTEKTLERLLQENSSKSPWGFIIFNENNRLRGYALHVLPVIIFPETSEILILDSIGLSTWISSSFSQISLEVKRQSDSYSCRTDALNILSNALWDIRQRNSPSLAALTEIKHNTLPPAWAKTVQKSMALAGVNIAAPIRTKSGQNLGEFIEKYSELEGDKKTRRYLWQKGRRYGAKIQALIKNPELYPEIWATFHKKYQVFEKEGFSLERPAFNLR